MAVAAQPHLALRWDGKRLEILDQTLLPAREEWIGLTGAGDTAAAIRRLAVRGAPLIGVAAAYGLAMEVARRPGLGTLERGWEELRGARPTAVNLHHAVDRVRAAARGAGISTMAAAARAEAQVIHAEEDAAVRNPAFDVTPAELISALVTERSVAAPPTTASIAALLR